MQQEIALITKQIEEHTKQSAFKVLYDNRFQQNSGSFTDYSEAKTTIFLGMWIDGVKYKQIIKWICEYLNV
jgi:hypothetical protein